MAGRKLLKLDIILPSANNGNNINTLEPISKQEIVIETPQLQPQQQPPSIVLDVGNNFLTAGPVSRVSTAGHYSAGNPRSEQMLHSGRSSRGRLAEDYKSLMFKHTDLEQVKMIDALFI